ncbi:MAG: C4-type zinc ribbon domain-containing protein, partial [Calditerrivibrio sp.]|nr:C4-type zinc ribbon domain-containing protein [Calditerrivibrio sp.]
SVLKELDILKKEITENESKLLEISYKIESTESDLSEISGRKSELDQKYEELQKRRDLENQEVTEELKDLEIERKTVAEKIRKQYLSKYEVIRKARNNLAIVRIDKEICSGCYMKVPPQLYVEVKKNSSVHQCPNCQRFLYYREGEEQ